MNYEYKYLKYKHKLKKLKGGGANWNPQLDQWQSNQSGIPGQYAQLEAETLNLLNVKVTNLIGGRPDMLSWWNGERVSKIHPNTLDEAISNIDHNTLKLIIQKLKQAINLRIEHQEGFDVKHQGHLDFIKATIKGLSRIEKRRRAQARWKTAKDRDNILWLKRREQNVINNFLELIGMLKTQGENHEIEILDELNNDIDDLEYKMEQLKLG